MFKINSLSENYSYLKQLHAFIKWCRSKDPGPFSVKIISPWLETTWSSGKPSDEQSSNSYLYILKTDSNSAFLKSKEKQSDWVELFHSFELNIWTKRPLKSDRLILKLDNREKFSALQLARTSLIFLLDNKSIPTDYIKQLDDLDVFKSIANISVAIWVNGKLRGCRFVYNKSLSKALIEGTRKACRDTRFKPIKKEEVGNARLQITVMSDLEIPLSKTTERQHQIETHLGYTARAINHSGTYLPEIFNCIHFKSMREMLDNLIYQKAGIERNISQVININQFMVDDFIESTDRRKALELNGPMISLACKPINKINLKIISDQAVNQVTSLQDTDGYINPMFNPLTGKSKAVGWARSACTVLALAEYGIVTHNPKAVEQARLGLKYLEQFVFDTAGFSSEKFAAMLVYIGKTAGVLEEDRILNASIQYFNFKKPLYSPILYANIASLYAEHGPAEKLHIAKEYTEAVWNDFTQKKKQGLSISLASYPELIVAYTRLENRHSKTTYSDRIEHLSQWYKKQQLADGSFRNYSGTGFSLPYTRGTGKIFEALSLDYKRNKASVDKMLHWLSTMQYTEENSFYVEPDYHLYTLGGFRHDYVNPEIWIDASAHFLIGTSRLHNQLN
jgi:AMMECR1 domain-containing protein